MSSKSKSAPELSDTYIIGTGEQTQEIFMSYGILTLLASYAQSLEQAASLLTSPDTQRIYAQILLAPKNEKGKPELEKSDLDLVPYSSDEVLKLVSWGVDHVISFLFKSIQAQASVMTKHVGSIQKFKAEVENLTALTSTPNGSEVSASTTPSV